MELVAGGVAPTELPAQGGLSLAPLGRGTSPGGQGGVATEALVAGEATAGGVDPDATRFSAEGEIGTIGLWGATLETREGAAGVEVTPALDREGTLPSQRALNASLKDYFESSQSLERSRTGAAGAAREASGPRAFRVGDTVSRVSADTVFSASRRSSLSKTVSAGLWVALVLGVSLAGLWVWSELDPGGGLGAAATPAAGLGQGAAGKRYGAGRYRWTRPGAGGRGTGSVGPRGARCGGAGAPRRRYARAPRRIAGDRPARARTRRVFRRGAPFLSGFETRSDLGGLAARARSRGHSPNSNRPRRLAGPAGVVSAGSDRSRPDRRRPTPRRAPSGSVEARRGTASIPI